MMQALLLVFLFSAPGSALNVKGTTQESEVALKEIHNSFDKQYAVEASSGTSAVQQGEKDVAEGISELRSMYAADKDALQKERERIEKKSKEDDEILNLMSGDASKVPLEEIKSRVATSLEQRKEDIQQSVKREKEGIRGLSKVNDGSK